MTTPIHLSAEEIERHVAAVRALHQQHVEAAARDPDYSASACSRSTAGRRRPRAGRDGDRGRAGRARLMRTIETIHIDPELRGRAPRLGDAVEIRVHHWQRGEEAIVGQVVSLRHLGGELAPRDLPPAGPRACFVGLDLPGRYEMVWVEAEGCRVLERAPLRLVTAGAAA